MKKSIILIICGLITTCLAIFASGNQLLGGGEYGPYELEVELREGWNIISGTIPEDGILADSEITIDNVESMWYYSPLQKKYLQVYPDTDWSALQKDDDDFVLNNAMWIYSNKRGKLRYTTLEDYPSLNERVLYAGWNFLSITPNMASGNSLNDVKGSCNFEKVYHFETSIQEWSSNLAKDDFMDERLTNSALGLGLVVKVSDDCNLGSSSNVQAPPSIPN